MKKVDAIIVRALYYVCSFLMFLMLADIFAQVVSRYALGKSLTWSEELGRYLFVWMSFLGMAVAINKGSHVALDILVTVLKNTSKRVLIIINNAFVIFFGIVLTYSGYMLVQLGFMQTSPTLKIPMEFVYIVIPISGILLIYFLVSQTIQFLNEKEEQV